jgi:adenylate kinase
MAMAADAPGKSLCFGKVGHRKDDTPEGVEKRYKVFTSQTLDVIAYFREKGLLLEVDASKTPEEVDAQIVAGLKSTEEE